MTRKIKTAATAYPVPQSRDAAVEAVAEIGRRQRERERLQAEMNDELAVVKQAVRRSGRPARRGDQRPRRWGAHLVRGAPG